MLQVDDDLPLGYMAILNIFSRTLISFIYLSLIVSTHNYFKADFKHTLRSSII